MHKLCSGDGFPGSYRGEHPDLKNAELYNLARDIGEQTNLAAAEPEKVKELAAAWSQWNSELVAPLWYHPLAAAKKAK